MSQMEHLSWSTRANCGGSLANSSVVVMWSSAMPRNDRMSSYPLRSMNSDRPSSMASMCPSPSHITEVASSTHEAPSMMYSTTSCQVLTPPTAAMGTSVALATSET